MNSQSQQRNKCVLPSLLPSPLACNSSDGRHSRPLKLFHHLRKYHDQEWYESQSLRFHVFQH